LVTVIRVRYRGRTYRRYVLRGCRRIAREPRNGLSEPDAVEVTDKVDDIAAGRAPPAPP
jgi:hypothetical protein